eukprot:772413-Rhodomonas_salina.1
MLLDNNPDVTDATQIQQVSLTPETTVPARAQLDSLSSFVPGLFVCQVDAVSCVRLRGVLDDLDVYWDGRCGTDSLVP